MLRVLLLYVSAKPILWEKKFVCGSIWGGGSPSKNYPPFMASDKNRTDTWLQGARLQLPLGAITTVLWIVYHITGAISNCKEKGGVISRPVIVFLKTSVKVWVFSRCLLSLSLSAQNG